MVDSCVIASNQANEGGNGIQVAVSSNPRLVNTTVCFNAISIDGGSSLEDLGGNQILDDCPLIVASDGTGFYDSIQSAIDSASDGGLILVGPGTYNENQINTNGKSLSIVGSVDSENMPTSVIDAAGSSQNVLLVRNGESPQYSNFIITNGSAGNGGGAFMTTKAAHNSQLLFHE